MYMYVCIYMVFFTEGLFEVAIESWPEWDLNPRPHCSGHYYYYYYYFITVSFIHKKN